MKVFNFIFAKNNNS